MFKVLIYFIPNLKNKETNINFYHKDENRSKNNIKIENKSKAILESKIKESNLRLTA